MPLFSFYCEKCRATSEILVRGASPVTCPKCGSEKLVKQTSIISPQMGHEKAGMAAPSGCAGCCSRGSCPNAS